MKLKREDLPAGEVLCDHCSAKCCRYFALAIDKPTDFDESENIRWFMFHGKVGIFTDNGQWYLMVINDCEHLREDNRCGIYEERPPICRSYSTDQCEYDDDSIYDQYFERPEQMAEYRIATEPMKNKRRFSTAPREAVDVQLPVLSG